MKSCNSIIIRNASDLNRGYKQRFMPLSLNWKSSFHSFNAHCACTQPRIPGNLIFFFLEAFEVVQKFTIYPAEGSIYISFLTSDCSLLMFSLFSTVVTEVMNGKQYILKKKMVKNTFFAETRYKLKKTT